MYLLHRTALSPLLPGTDNEAVTQSCRQIQLSGERKFMNFLLSNDLGPLWYTTLTKTDQTHLVSDNFLQQLRDSCRATTAIYLLQQQALANINSHLEAASIPHAVIKGAHVRELIYSEPALRYACDIDILIPKSEQINAIRTLVSTGYEFKPTKENISHEATLYKKGASIDLHWDILRTGRTRVPMTDELLSTRKDFSTHWGLDNVATLYLMLVHPVLLSMQHHLITPWYAYWI